MPAGLPQRARGAHTPGRPARSRECEPRPSRHTRTPRHRVRAAPLHPPTRPSAQAPSAGNGPLRRRQQWSPTRAHGSEVVCQSTGQHSTERVPEHRERLVTNPVTNLSRHREHDILRARHVAGGTLAVARKVEVQPPPSASSLDQRVQRQQQPMINRETMQQHQRDARPPLDDMHTPTVEPAAVPRQEDWPDSADTSLETSGSTDISTDTSLETDNFSWNLQPIAASSQPLAISTNLLKCSWCATVIVAVGPLRCLPTMMSASPARGSSRSNASGR